MGVFRRILGAQPFQILRRRKDIIGGILSRVSARNAREGDEPQRRRAERLRARFIRVFADAARVAYIRTSAVSSLLYRDSEIDKAHFEISCVLRNVMSPVVLLVSSSSRRKVLCLP